MSPDEWTYESITIVLLPDDGAALNEARVMAEVWGHWAVHPTVNVDPLYGEWALTHIPTGTGIGPPINRWFLTKQAAKEFAAYLDPMRDWGRVTKTTRFTATWKKEVRHRAKCIDAKHARVVLA